MKLKIMLCCDAEWLTNGTKVYTTAQSQMTSKCGKNKNVAHKAIAECVTDVLTTFWRLLWSITEQTRGNTEPVLFYVVRILAGIQIFSLSPARVTLISSFLE